MTTALLYAMVLLAGGGGLILLVGRHLSVRWSARLTPLLFLGALVPLIWLRGGPAWVVPSAVVPLELWVVRVVYRFDPFVALFALLAGGVAFLLALWVALADPDGEGWFAGWPPFLLALFLNLLLSGNLLQAFVAWEGVLLATYLLLTDDREGLPTPGIGEWFLGLHHGAGYPLLVALLLLDHSAGSLHESLIRPEMVSPVVLLLVLATVWLRMAQVPAHTWTVAVAESPGPVSTLLLGGGGLLAGPYLWLRFLSWVPPLQRPFLPGEVAMAAGSLSLIVGAALALRQGSGRRVLAADTVSRMGLLLLALGTNHPLGLAAALFFLPGLLLSKLAFHLAFAPGGWRDPAGRRTLFTLAAWETAGLPLSPGFVGRWLLAMALFQMARPVHLVLLLLATPLALAYLWRGRTLLPQETGEVTRWRAWMGPACTGLVVLLPVGGLATPWLWGWLWGKAAMVVQGSAVSLPRPLLEALWGWGWPWGGLLLLLLAGGSLGAALSRRRRRLSLPEPLLLREPLPVLTGETAWLAWLGRPASLYRFLSTLAGRLNGGIQRSVAFLEHHVTYFLLVILVLAGVILVILTR